MVHAARAIAGLILAITALSATAAPRVATHDDGSAAVTLDGGLTIVLGRAVTRHFLSPADAHVLLAAVRRGDAPTDIVATMELREEH